MAQFINIPPLRIGRKGQWLLTEELIYDSDLIGIVKVHEGFETDLASIPRIATPVHPVNGKHRPAAIVHDYLCRSQIVRRKTADKVFLEAMRVLDVAVWRRYSMYLAVRALSIWLALGRRK